MRILVIIPGYEHFDYTANAVSSAIQSSTDQAEIDVFVTDDASPGWVAPAPLELLGVLNAYGKRVCLVPFAENQGLTHAWNYGLKYAACGNYDFACCANNDLIFAKDWWLPLVSALNAGYDLVGPVTNAPGTGLDQEVFLYCPPFKLSDAPSSIEQTAGFLRSRYGSECRPATLNGFCMMAKTKTWHEHAFAVGDVFRPRNDFNSKGQRNPTPLMTLNEYELQRRWHEAGLCTGFCPGSYVFHYRSVARGDRYKSQGWFRRQKCR